MKVRVSGMAWLPVGELGPNGVAYLKKALTIVPRKYAGYSDEKPRPIKCYRDRDGWLGVPRAYFFQTASMDHDIEWACSDGAPMSDYKSLLRHEGKYAEQADAIEAMLGHFRNGSVDRERGLGLGGLLRGVPGFGKTNVALAIAHRIGRSTLVIVHKEFLMRQWIRRIEKFMPGARVGVAQEGRCEFDGMDFTVAMIQSLSREDGNRYPDEFYKHHGLIVVDEAHRIGAATFAPVPSMFDAKYIIGLTATPRRKDGADKVFWWSIGKIVFSAKTETPKPLVRMVETDANGPDILSDGSISPSVAINILTKLTKRNQVAVSETVKALRSNKGRKVMVISERLEQLRELESQIRVQAEAEGIDGFTTGFYVGEWFTGEKSLSLRRVRELDLVERTKAIDSIYRHFRRQKAMGEVLDVFLLEDTGLKGKRKKTELWNGKCGRLRRAHTRGESENDVFTEDHEITLYKHGYARRTLESLSGKQLCSMARDYEIAQAKSKPMRKARTEEQLIEAERARVILATYQMCSEGTDIPAIDTQVMASPVSDVEQAVGRIRRFCIPERFGGDISPEDCEHLCPWRADTCEGKPDPIVSDIVDRRFSLTRKRKKYRLSFYRDHEIRVGGSVD